MTETAVFVQFPHPGRENVPTGDVVPWNTKPRHKRKYLVASGTTVDVRGRALSTGDLCFWGEWEPPSRIVHRWDRAPALPTAVHEPFWASPGPSGFRQNTDPWVFGREFFYSNCKQLRMGSPTALQRLPAGSVILFGSTLRGQFVLDTVFVVAALVCRWTPVADPNIGGSAFRECTVQSVGTGRHAEATFTLYRGATANRPISGMFSFVPCQRRTGAGWPRFERPTVYLPGVVNPKSQQSTSGANIRHRLSEIHDLWATVAAQVKEQGLDFGGDLRTPSLASVKLVTTS